MDYGDHHQGLGKAVVVVAFKGMMPVAAVSAKVWLQPQ